MRRAYWDYIDQIITPENNDDEDNKFQGMKKFWQYIKTNQKDYHGVATLKANGKISTTAIDKANTLNEQFQSVFSPPQDIPSDLSGHSPHPTSQEITFTTHGIYKMLRKLKTH